MKAVKDLAEGKAASVHSHSGADVAQATTTARGTVQLSTATTSTDTTKAATPSAIKAVKDIADGKAASDHLHDASDIVSGTLSTDRLPANISPISVGTPTNTLYGGSGAGTNNTGTNVNAFGEDACYGSNQGSSVNAMGWMVGKYNKGSFVNAFGLGAAVRNDGDHINAMGANAGYGNSADNCNFFGNNAGYSNTHSSVTLFHGAQATGDNQIRLGGTSYSTFSGSYQNISDKRDKIKIVDSPLGLDFIKKLRTVRYCNNDCELYREITLNDKDEPVVNYAENNGSHAGKRHRYGLIAQEVGAITEDKGISFAGYQDHCVNGGEQRQSLDYTQFIAPLIKAVQELSEQNETLAARLDALGE